MDLKRAGSRDAACGYRLLQVDIERRNRPATFGPAQRARHGKMVPREPQPFCGIFRRRQQVRRFRKPDVAGHGHGLVGDEPRHRAILLLAIRHRVLHETRIDHDRLFAWQARRHERPCAGAGNILANPRAGTVDHRIRAGFVSGRKTDAAEFVFCRRERVPLRGRGQWSRCRREALAQGRDQGMLLDPALQLPRPKPNQQRRHREREQAETSDVVPPHLCLDHFGSRSISRPSAAL